MYKALVAITQNRLLGSVLFALFCVAFFLLHSPYLLNYPTGLHFIRQTDSLSFSMYYLLKDNFNFFDIGNLSLNFRDGRAACELPLFYFLYFLIFKLFGVNFTFIRVFSLLVFLFSIGYLFKKLRGYFENWFLPLVLIVFVSSSSVLSYFSINFLPDSLALSFTLIGIAHLFRVQEEGEKNHPLLPVVFLTLAALLKAYYAIYLALYLLHILLSQKRLSIKAVLPALLGFVCILFWYLYSIHYNKVYGSNYYLTSFNPIWIMSMEEIEVTWKYMTEFWYPKYYLPSVFHLLLFFLVLCFLPGIIRSMQKRLLFYVGTLMVLVYVLLFFKQFKDHDYYFLPLIPYFLMISVYAVEGVLNLKRYKAVKVGVLMALFAITIIAFDYSMLNLKRRFSNSADDFSKVAYQLGGSQKWLDSLKIGASSKFLVVGDRTPNGSLVILRRFGWSFKDFSPEVEKISEELADYLIILEPSQHTIPSELNKKLKTCEKYVYKSNYIYKLQNKPKL
jgi:hypothetical protein